MLFKKGEIKELSALKKFGIILNEDKEINVLEKLIGKGVSNDSALKLINKLDIEELKKLHSFLEKKPSDFDASEIVDKILGGEKVDDVIRGGSNLQLYQKRINDIRKVMPNSKLQNRGNMAIADVDIKGLKNEYVAHSKIKKVGDKGADLADFSRLKSEDERIFTSYVEDKFPRYQDTEAKILEDIATNIKDPNMSGTINLYSELPCCQSCSNVILEFRRKFPNIKLNVYVGK